MFSSRGTMFSALTFRSVMCFYLIFVYDVRYRSNFCFFSFCITNVQFAPVSFIEKDCSFPHFIFLVHLSKLNLPIHGGFIYKPWAHNSTPRPRWLCPLQQFHTVLIIVATASFEVGKFKSSNLQLCFFSKYFDSFCLLESPYEF